MIMTENDEVKYLDNLIEQDDPTAKVGSYGRVNSIEYDVYLSKNVEDMGKYLDLHGETKRLTDVIKRANKPFLIYGAKGIGKTSLVHHICRKEDIALVEFSCGIGTNKSDLKGRLQVDKDGSYFERGVLPTAFLVANHFGHAVLYLDEIGALEHDVQKWLNRPLDDRHSCEAGGKKYTLKEGCKLAIIATTNPIEYAGVNNLTEDLRSRFIGQRWTNPTSEELEEIIDWTDIPTASVKEPLLTQTQNIYSSRIQGDVEYVLSPRDLKQFTEVYRELIEDGDLSGDQILEETIKESILIKYTDPNEHELVKSRCQETFGVTIA